MTPLGLLMFVALLICSGIAINLYLYNRGIFRVVRFRRFRRLQPATARTMSNEAAVGDQFYKTFEPVNDSSHVARMLLLIVLSILLGAVLVGAATISTVLH